MIASETSGNESPLKTAWITLGRKLGYTAGMVRMIRGEVVDIAVNNVVVDVSGVGYLIYVRNSASFTYREEVHLWTHLAVRETALDLYGFVTRDELGVFELLLTLPKIGPKSALQILAQADISLIKQAVAEQDASYLAKLSGIGKKTAEKIVLELKDKFDDVFIAGGATAGAAPTSRAADLVDALISLGYSPTDAREVAREVPADITDTSEAIKIALKRLH